MIKSKRMKWTGYVARIKEKVEQDIDGKARIKEITWKTK
jgi:hypothetical protein